MYLLPRGPHGRAEAIGKGRRFRCTGLNRTLEVATEDGEALEAEHARTAGKLVRRRGKFIAGSV